MNVKPFEHQLPYPIGSEVIKDNKVDIVVKFIVRDNEWHYNLPAENGCGGAWYPHAELVKKSEPSIRTMIILHKFGEL